MTDEFFDPLPEPPQRDRSEPAIWFQPPSDELATLVPDRRVLARTDEGVVLLLSHIDAFNEGCSFRIRVSAHRRDEIPDDDWHELHETMMGGHRFARRRSSGALPDDLLRFGVQFTDGSKATTTGAPWPHQRDQAPEGYVLLQHGGGGSGSDRLVTSSWTLWLWPLPPPEPFDFVFSWPALGIDLTRVEIAGQRIAEAAGRTRPVGRPDGLSAADQASQQRSTPAALLR